VNKDYHYQKDLENRKRRPKAWKRQTDECRYWRDV